MADIVVERTVRMKRLILLLTLLSLLIVGQAWGATVYHKVIAGSGYYDSSASSCSDVTTADTAGDLDDARQAAGAGGTLYYCTDCTGTEINFTSVLGVDDNQTIEGLNGSVLDCDGANYAIYGNDDDNVTLINVKATGGDQYGIFFDNGSDGGTITGGSYYGNDDAGIQLTSCSNWTISGGSSSNNTGNATTVHGIRISGGSGNTVENWTSSSNGTGTNDGRGLTLTGGTATNIVQDCTFKDNGSATGGVGVEIYNADTNTVQRNWIEGSRGGTEWTADGGDTSDDNKFLNNVIISTIDDSGGIVQTDEGGTCDNALFANNTIYVGGGQNGIRLEYNNALVKNNVVQLHYDAAVFAIYFEDINEAGINSISFMNNYIYLPESSQNFVRDSDATTSYSSLADFKTAFAYQDEANDNSTWTDTADPRLDTTYCPKLRSPVIDAGTVISGIDTDYYGRTRIIGSGPDIGA